MLFLILSRFESEHSYSLAIDFSPVFFAWKSIMILLIISIGILEFYLRASSHSRFLSVFWVFKILVISIFDTQLKKKWTAHFYLMSIQVFSLLRLMSLLLVSALQFHIVPKGVNYLLFLLPSVLKAYLGWVVCTSRCLVSLLPIASIYLIFEIKIFFIEGLVLVFIKIWMLIVWFGFFRFCQK